MDWGCAYEESMSKDVNCIRSAKWYSISRLRFEDVDYVWSGLSGCCWRLEDAETRKLVDRKRVLRERLDNSGFKTV